MVFPVVAFACALLGVSMIYAPRTGLTWMVLNGKLKKYGKLGFRYLDGKVLVFQMSGNPSAPDKPSWAVDIREIIAMAFVGAGAICLISKGSTNEAMILLVGLLGYATGRTVPGGK